MSAIYFLRSLPAQRPPIGGALLFYLDQRHRCSRRTALKSISLDRVRLVLLIILSPSFGTFIPELTMEKTHRSALNRSLRVPSFTLCPATVSIDGTLTPAQCVDTHGPPESNSQLAHTHTQHGLICFNTPARPLQRGTHTHTRAYTRCFYHTPSSGPQDSPSVGLSHVETSAVCACCRAPNVGVESADLVTDLD